MWVFYEEEIIVHTIIDPNTGKITQPAVASDFKDYGKSYLTIGIIIYIMIMRFQLSIPYARLERFFSLNGFPMARQLMANTVNRHALSIFEAIIHRMWVILVAAKYLQIDETPTIIREVRKNNDEPTSLCYMWVFRTSEMLTDSPQIVIFHYDESRGEEVLDECLADFKGTYMTDCHKPYHSYAEKNSDRIVSCACLNHSRSRFADVLRTIPGLKELPEEVLKKIPAYNVICMFRDIFKLDKSIRSLSAEERKLNRKQLVRPAFEKLAKYIESFGATDFIEGGLMDKAINYFKNNKPYLEGFLDDPFVPNNNSACERDNAGYAILRNNIKFIDTIDGAYATANMYSIKATCNANGADFGSYVSFVIDEVTPLIEDIPSGKYKEMTILDEYMPWSNKFKEYALNKKALSDEIITTGNLYIHEKNYVEVPWPKRRNERSKSPDAARTNEKI